MYGTRTPAPEIYPLSLHDALPISFEVIDDPSAALLTPYTHLVVCPPPPGRTAVRVSIRPFESYPYAVVLDRKSTRLNSSHMSISYAVFCLKKNTRSHTVLFSGYTA